MATQRTTTTVQIDKKQIEKASICYATINQRIPTNAEIASIALQHYIETVADQKKKKKAS